MIRDRRTSTAATAYVWALDHLRRRFGASGWPTAQAAAALVFERRIVSGAATGSVADLERQGLVRRTRRPRRGNLVGVVPYRCVSLERVRGLNFAWGGDALACVNRNVALRRHRARQLREERRQIMARLEAKERLYVLTDLGRAALVAAGLAADRVALTPRGSRTPA
jgi:DNA-binding MarR family transcriptional regulator